MSYTALTYRPKVFIRFPTFLLFTFFTYNLPSLLINYLSSLPKTTVRLYPKITISHHSILRIKLTGDYTKSYLNRISHNCVSRYEIWVIYISSCRWGVFARGEIVTTVFSNKFCVLINPLNVFELTALTIQILLQ